MGNHITHPFSIDEGETPSKRLHPFPVVKRWNGFNRRVPTSFPRWFKTWPQFDPQIGTSLFTIKKKGSRKLNSIHHPKKGGRQGPGPIFKTTMVSLLGCDESCHFILWKVPSWNLSRLPLTPLGCPGKAWAVGIHPRSCWNKQIWFWWLGIYKKEIHSHKSHTVDGSEIRLCNQLRSVDYPIIYARVLYIPGG